MDLHVADGAGLDATTLYALLRLRSDVFVVEQECPYQDLDGRDLEPGTRHLWLAGAPAGAGSAGTHATGRPVAYLRIVIEPDGSARIGRVCVDRAARGGGHARTLMDAAMNLTTGRVRVLAAQSYLVGFYTGYGFTPAGPEFLDDGIPHVPMAR